MAEESQQPADLFEVLQQACDRNTPLELHYINPGYAASTMEPETLRAQTRLLSLQPDSLLVDFPQDIGRTLRLRSGHHARAYFTVGETIYHFPTTITELQYRMELNQEKRIIGCRLARPERIITAQRREDHRVSVAAQDGFSVAIHEAGSDILTAIPLKARRGIGRIVNISRGGMGIRIDGEQRLKFRPGQYCFYSFSLPTASTPIIILGEFQHSRNLGRDACLMGVQFLRWPDPAEYRTRIGTIGRFIVDLERAQLKATQGYGRVA